MKSEEYRVYVLDISGRPLMPTKRFGKVRRMLKDGRAKVVERKPFTVQLLYEPETHVVQEVVLGIDPGRTNIGIAAVRSDGTCLMAGEVKTRNREIPGLMAERKMHRQASRRGERLRRKRRAKKNGTTTDRWNPRRLPGCQKPVPVKDIRNTEARFSNRKRPKGWLTPTARQLLQTHGNLAALVCRYLPVSSVSVEVNRFAFMKLDDPAIRGAAYQKGPLHGFSGVREAIETIQGNRCLLCGAPTEHLHHIVPRSQNGMDTLENLAGLCADCHEQMHKDAKAAAALGQLKKGTRKKHAGASVLNQIMPKLLEDLDSKFQGRVTVTEGFCTKDFRDAHGIAKTHAADAYCIACAALGRQTVIDPPEHPFELKQYRRHDRARIKAQTQRTYRLDGEIVARNRRKAEGQHEDSLQEWYAKMVTQYGKKQASAMRSRLTAAKSKRRRNSPDRVMPGTIFMYRGKRYVLKGQLTGGKYYRAEGEGAKNFPAKECQIVKPGTGLVFL